MMHEYAIFNVFMVILDCLILMFNMISKGIDIKSQSHLYFI